MRESLILLAFAAALSICAPRPLRRARWPTRAPRLAITVWLGLSVATLAGMLAAALAAATALPPVSHGIADLLRACLHGYRVDLHLPIHIAIAGGLGTVSTLLLPGWVAGNVLRLLRTNARTRRRHLRLLSLTAHP